MASLRRPDGLIALLGALIQRSRALHSLVEEHSLVLWFSTTRDIVKYSRTTSRKLLGISIYQQICGHLQLESIPLHLCSVDLPGLPVQTRDASTPTGAL
jgi:hypothetical protein